ncbi:hypothetical protein [Chondromyces apiculatus]|uniref:Uncharacterized protein n=1 Tax=Chondromyces apiculatus DSM 436 TaxID=1192034 RepID=A0A017TDE4_9BACT|nr:hypothetical protein [Chondromyces apiculatus]EYF06840.1 Hypothetical protein CAP_1537 [Chondromyces apiculatus DSM 436]
MAGKQSEHMKPPDEAHWKFKRNRDGDKHIKNCDEGYYAPTVVFKHGGKVRNVREVHHVLCVHACSDATLPVKIEAADKKFIHDSLAITDWDINAAANNIGLPRKWAYVLDTDATLKVPGAPNEWDGLPCHQVDHDIYLDKVEEWVTENIWNKIRANKSAENCEYMKPEAVKNMFERGSRMWKALLRRRGMLHGGTRASLEYCQSGKEDPAKEDIWHKPFSMAMPEGDIRRRNKPPKGNLVRTGLLTMIK